ncbi:hypothetical protein [Flavobacterium undicola]|uniref:hypothetical protein n=1 Tax=Flavobacterium undicola TaxID=1932779 RepID=UPI001376BE8D|nr:hypothetical protein [Flavobacterium undicola]MBA0885481.1 hypothetical protein [Flavobacterium undicola]
MIFKESKIDLTKGFYVPTVGQGYLENEFELTPKDFLKFAKQDLKQDDERGYINSLTNSKRAIDCQIDEVLNKIGINYKKISPEIEKYLDYFEFEKDIPYKLKIINSLNLAPSLIISKTRNIGNKLEHIYEKPTKEDVREALDVADLLIRSISAKIDIIQTDFGITDEKNLTCNFLLNFENGIIFYFDTKKRHLKIESRIKNIDQKSVILNSNDKGYCGILRMMFSQNDDFELEESLKATLKHIGHQMPLDKASLIQVA